MAELASEGRFVVDESYGEVFSAVTDPETVGACLPDTVESIERTDDDAASVTLVVGVRTTQCRLHARLRRSAMDESAGEVAYVGSATGPRSAVDLEAELALSREDDGTAVSWSGTAEIRGLLASLGPNVGRFDRLVEGKIDATIANLERGLANGTEVSEP